MRLVGTQLTSLKAMCCRSIYSGGADQSSPKLFFLAPERPDDGTSRKFSTWKGMAHQNTSQMTDPCISHSLRTAIPETRSRGRLLFKKDVSQTGIQDTLHKALSSKERSRFEMMLSKFLAFIYIFIIIFSFEFIYPFICLDSYIPL